MLSLSQRPLSSSDADHRLFVDRNSELNRANRSLQLGLNIYISGPPGSGRTSFLHQIQRNSEEARYVRLNGLESLEDKLVEIERVVQGEGTLYRIKKESVIPQFEFPVRTRKVRVAGDPLVNLRRAAQLDPDQMRIVLLVDDLESSGRQELFGRLRDEMWELPIQWVVSGTDSHLDAPVDAFFETAIELENLEHETIRQLLYRRALSGTADERAVLRDIADAVSASIAPCTPRQALSVARDIFLSEDAMGASNRLEEMQELRSHLSGSASRVLDGLMVHGPTHAGDDQLLSEVGVTRSRVVQLLGELESAGLVTAQRVGRRKLYSAFPKPAIPEEASDRLGRGQPGRLFPKPAIPEEASADSFSASQELQ